MANATGDNRNGTFHVGFGKVSLDITSGHLLTILTIMGLFGLVGGAGYLQIRYVGDVRADHATIRQEHSELRQQLDEKLEVMIYLLSRPENERPALAVPQSVQQRLLSIEPKSATP